MKADDYIIKRGCGSDDISSDAEDFDKDRQEILDRLDACIAPRKQLHELEWELRKRSEEIRELQQV